MHKTHQVTVVGGGPAGMMCGLLLARAGVEVCVLEKHKDFLRDFRGDTVHPSTMEILHQLGMLERFLDRPHDRVDSGQIRIAGKDYTIADLSHLKTPAPFIAMMPQWDFLDFLRGEAEKFPGFSIEMESEVTGLTQEKGRISGVEMADGRHIGSSLLTVMCDGRGSIVRDQQLLPVKKLGAPMDVFWFRLPKHPHNGEMLRGAASTGRMIILIDRKDYWQAAFLIPKGAGEEYRAKGTEWIKEQCQQAFPELDLGGEGGLERDEDLFLLRVALNRLERWHRPGLLAIGDAAHAMSPIGGIGVNLAVQDAVAAANLLAERLAMGRNADNLLDQVQHRRMFPTRAIQAGQKLAQDNIIGAVLSGRPIVKAPLPVRLLNRFPLLRRIPGRIIGFGIQKERVTSPISPALQKL